MIIIVIIIDIVISYYYYRRTPSCRHKEKCALGIITLFPRLKDEFSPKGHVSTSDRCLVIIRARARQVQGTIVSVQIIFLLSFVFLSSSP